MKYAYSPETDTRIPPRLISFPKTLSQKTPASTQGSFDEEQVFQEFAEGLDLFIWAADAAGNKIFCNRQYLTYVGVTSIAAMDEAWHQAVHVEDRPKAREKWAAAIADKTNYECEYRLRRFDGVFRYFLARANPIRDDMGQIVRWIGSSVDVHDSKVLEETILEAEKLSVAARCASALAHQINNPLASVLNSVYLAQQDADLPESIRRLLAQASDELDRVVQVTRRSLGFQRQSGGAACAKLADLLSDALRPYAPRLESNRISVIREIDRIPDLICRAEDIRHVFANLILNAFHASVRGGQIRIRVRCAHQPSQWERQGIRITVADQGHGIPERLKDRLFRPFVSTKGLTSTGLGLWASMKIAREHGGTLRFRSSTRSGHCGTVFCLFLPFDGPIG